MNVEAKKKNPGGGFSLYTELLACNFLVLLSDGSQSTSMKYYLLS